MKKIALTNAVLKNIAYLTMLIDHFFAVVFTEIIRQSSAAGHETGLLRKIYSAGRAVGRVSFVLFACLMAEGFVHTRSRRAYLLRLGAFAAVSEVPFDLAFSGKIVDQSSQNIFFTLFLGVLAMTVWEWAEESLRMIGYGKNRGKARPKVPHDACWYLCIAVFRGVQLGGVILCCAAAYVLHTDYKYMGVLLIFTFYLLRGRGTLLQIGPVACVMLFGIWSVNCLRYSGMYSRAYLFRFSMRELYGLFAFIPIALYDGSRGRQLPKAVCYGFYPVHLLCLHGIARMIAMR